MARERSVGRRTTDGSAAGKTSAGRGMPRRLALGLVAGLGLAASAASAQTIVDEWATVTAPPAPALKPVTIDPKTTALLMLDLSPPTAPSARAAWPRCRR